MSDQQKDWTDVATVHVSGECTVQVSYLDFPVLSSSVYILSDFVVIEFGGRNQKFVSKNFINSIVAGASSEVARGDAYPMSAFQIGKSKVRTSDGREIEASNVQSEDDFIIVYMPDGRKLIIRKDFVKEIEEFLATGEDRE